MLAQLIREYHAQKKFPVFNLAAHHRLFTAQIDKFDIEGKTAIKRFAEVNGFLIVDSDGEFKYRFIPQNKPVDPDEWSEVEVVSR